MPALKQSAWPHSFMISAKSAFATGCCSNAAKLDNSEFAQIREHAVIGAEILRPINMLKSTISLILFHHERWDGSGYSVMIKGSEIPLVRAYLPSPTHLMP
jgi:hypothetical protein